MRIKYKYILLGIVALNFAFGDFLTTINFGGFSANAFISAVSVVLLALLCFLLFPHVLKKIPLSLSLFTVWMFISLILGFIYFRSLQDPVDYKFSTALQQFLTWVLFFVTLCIGIRLGKDDLVHKGFIGTVMLTSFSWSLLIFLPGNAFHTRSLTALLALLFSVLYAKFREKRALKWLFLALFSFAAIVITSSRTALMACLLAVIVNEFSDFRFLNLVSWRKVIPFLFIFSILIVFIFIYPPMFERLSNIYFSLQSLVIEKAVVDEGNFVTVTQGRSRVWPLLFDKALERPLLGKGVGTASAYSYYFSNNSRFTHPHNEYLRFFFDTGLLGLSLLLIAFLSIGRKLFQSIRREKSKRKQSSLFGLGALVVAATLFVTDNVGLYSFFMAPLGFILGLALANSLNKDKDNADILTSNQSD